MLIYIVRSKGDPHADDRRLRACRPVSADADPALGDELTHAVLRAEGVASPGPFHLDNTAAFIHRLPASAISTANTPSARTVRVQIVTPPGSLNRDGQRQIVREATEIVSRIAGDEGRPCGPG